MFNIKKRNPFISSTVRVAFLFVSFILITTWSPIYPYLLSNYKSFGDAANSKELCKLCLQHNLILSAATSMTLPSIWPFVQTARQTCSSCTIAIIIHENQLRNGEFQELSAFYNVTWLIYEHFNISKQHPHPGFYMHKLRWYVFDEYFNLLEAQNARFDNVFIGDTRDIFFQTNVFHQMKTYGTGLYVFAIVATVPNGVNSFMRPRLVKCFGNHTFARLADKPTLCAGTTLGSWSTVRLLVTTMQTHISNNTRPMCTALPNDQPFYNYIIYLTDISNQIAVYHVPHETGFVASVGYAKTVIRNRFGQILNDNRQVYAVVHHYDRFKDLALQYSPKLYPRDSQLYNEKAE